MDLRGEVGDEGTGGALRAIGIEREFDTEDVVLLPDKPGGGDVAEVGDSGRHLPEVGVSPERTGSVGWAPPWRAPLLVAAGRKQWESNGPGKWDKHPAPTGYVLLRGKEDSRQGEGVVAATKTSEPTRGTGGPDDQAVSQARTVYESSVSLPEAMEEALGYLQGHGFTRRADGGLIAPGETAGVVARQADGKVDISGEIPRDGAWVGGRGPLLIPPSSRWMGADLGVGSGTGVVKAGGGFSDDPIVPKVFGGKGWLGDVPNPYAGMLGAVDSSAIQSKPGKQDLPGIKPDGWGGDVFAGRGEVTGDGATKVYENAAGGGLGGSKLSTPTAKAPGLSSGEPVVISGYMPDALERLHHHGRTLPSEPNIPKDSPLTRDQGKYVEDWVTLNLQTRLPGFGRLPADDQKRMVREGIALYYDPDKLEKLWATGGWTKDIFRRTPEQKLPDGGQFPDPSPEYNKLLPSMRKVSPLDSDQWPKYLEAATKIVDTHPYFLVPDPKSDSDDPVMRMTGTRRMDYIHRVAMQLAGVTQNGYDYAQSQRDAGSRSMQATLGASWFGTSSQVLGTLFKSVGAQRLGQFYEDTGSDLLANGVNPNHVWTRELGETLGGITPALGIYAAGGFVPMLVAGTLISGKSAYDRGKEAKLSDAQLGGYVGLHMLSSVATTLIMRRFAPSSSAGATAHGAGAGFGGNVVANAIDKLFINPNISLLDNSFQATVGGGITGYVTQRAPLWKARPGTLPSQPKGRAPSFLGMNPEEFKMLRARLSAVKYLDEAALKKMGVKDPARVKRALGRLSRMGEFETPEGLWKASMHPEFLDAFHEMMAGFDQAASRNSGVNHHPTSSTKAISGAGGKTGLVISNRLSKDGESIRRTDSDPAENSGFPKGDTEGTPDSLKSPVDGKQPIISAGSGDQFPAAKPGKYELIPADHARALAFANQKVTPEFAYGVWLFENNKPAIRLEGMSDSQWRQAMGAYNTAKGRQGGIASTALNLGGIKDVAVLRDARKPLEGHELLTEKVKLGLDEFHRLWGITIPYAQPLKVLFDPQSKDTGSYLPWLGMGKSLTLNGKEVEHTISHELAHWIWHEMVGLPLGNEIRTISQIWDPDIRVILEEVNETGGRNVGQKALMTSARKTHSKSKIAYLARQEEVFARVFERATNHLVGRRQSGYGLEHDFTIFSNNEMERIIPHVKKFLQRYRTEQFRGNGGRDAIRSVDGSGQ
jgi:hypothetical protein